MKDNKDIITIGKESDGMKIFTNTGHPELTKKLMRAKSKVDILLKIEDEEISRLIRMYNFSLSKKELLEIAADYRKGIEPFIKEVVCD